MWSIPYFHFMRQSNIMEKIKLSQRTQLVTQSEIRAMSIECEKMGGINLSQGVVDTEVPFEVKRGACDAINSGVNTYTRYDGLRELKEAIARKQKKFTGLEYDPENEIVVSSGATGALCCTCLALLEPGDEVIVFEPYYGYHVSTLLLSGVVPVFVRLDPPMWALREEDIEKAITKKTRGMIINTPANPSGKVFSRSELETIAGIARKHDLLIITDEIYEHFVYDGSEHLSPAGVSDLRERTVVISGFSKIFSITGWRIGYALCNKSWAKAIGYFNDLIYVCAPAPLQMGAAAGLLNLKEEYYTLLEKEYHRKRDKICGALSIAKCRPQIPQGAYYVLADISGITGRNSKERVMNFLKKTGVAAVPGGAFYHDDSGETLARFCFAKKNGVLDEACRRIERFKE